MAFTGVLYVLMIRPALKVVDHRSSLSRKAALNLSPQYLKN